MRFGVQLYGLSEVFKKAPEACLKRLSEMGYGWIEPCVTLENGDWTGGAAWTEDDFAVYMPDIKKYHLAVESCHISFECWDGAGEKMVEFGRQYGIRQFVCPCPADVTQDAYETFAEIIMPVAEVLAREGIKLLLHNGANEIRVKFGNQTAYEWLLKRCGGMIGAQPDLGWILNGGEDPEEFLWKNKGLIWSIHYKDMDKCRCETSLGTGTLDVTACFQFARAKELIQYVDQDASKGDFLDDLHHSIQCLKLLTSCRERTKSRLCILDTETGSLTELAEFDEVIEAPNWKFDTNTLIYNSNGRIWSYDIQSGARRCLDTGMCVNCNNDHVLSSDQKRLAVSHAQEGSWKSGIYILPAEGGDPVPVPTDPMSFLHGWSPDGKALSYCGICEGEGGWSTDIYTVSEDGKLHRRLTQNNGFNDGPEYSPDGQYIWFCSTRTGLMQVWRMKNDGSEQTQMACTDRNDWFPHVSRDGKKVVYLSYSQLGLDADEHLPNMHVELWMMDSDGSHRRKLLSFFGGQGSMNVNSWSKDSRFVALVTYELEHL